MTIPFIDFTREYAALQKEIDSAIQRVPQRGFFILGPEVERFEKDFATYCGVRFAVGVASGTDALYLSLLATGIGKGDEVIVPVNTALATAMAVVMSGAQPVFCDCDESFLIAARKIPALVTKRTKAIIPVHLYGRACDMDAITKLATAHGLLVIEDCAQAAGAEWIGRKSLPSPSRLPIGGQARQGLGAPFTKGRKVGGLGDFGCFSFYPTKALGAYGDGGAVLTNSAAHYKELLALRYYGQPDRVVCKGFGVNSRLDELQAAILNVKLRYLDEWNRKRQEIAEWYRNRITNPRIILPETAPKGRHVFHLFVARAKDRAAVMKKLKAKGIQTLIHYPLLLHQQPFFKNVGEGTFPKAEQFSKEIFSLPLYPFLEEAEVRRIADVLNAI